MGTPANTRISNKSDYIDHYTRWDGYPPEIHDNMVSSVSDWELGLLALKENISDDEQGTMCINKWIKIFEKNLESYKINPTIEFASFLHCVRSFSHHHVVPTHINTETDISANLTNEPNLTAHLINHDFSYSYDSIAIEQPIIEVERKEISPEFKVLRIYETDADGVINNHAWTDFKYKNMDEQQLFSSILKLPLFLRDVYTLTKMSRTEQESLHYNVGILPRLMHKLAQFYQPTSEYARFTRNKKDSARSVEERKKTIDMTTHDAVNMIPFDLYAGSLGTHIMLANAGNILPLTKAESLSDYDISFKVCLYGDRLNYVFCHIPYNNGNETVNLLNDLVVDYDNQINYFDRHHKVNTITDPIQFVKLAANPEEFVGLAYEKTIIDLMENQQSIEINSWLEERDD